jgi:hypothetical protein
MEERTRDIKEPVMPTLVIENIPAPLFDRIRQLAATQQRTPADTVLAVLETALRTQPAMSEPPLPDEPFLTQEIPAPFDIPWPQGERVGAIEITDYVPKPHDLPDED